MRALGYIVIFTLALLGGMTVIDSPLAFVLSVIFFGVITAFLVAPADRARARDDEYNLRRRIEAERAMREVHLAPRSRYDVFHDGMTD